ncbi:RNA polymerase sigma factor [Flaviaesturariibacter flavus]|uniref:RNA polymerase sigma factor n=1 Tax=Flaviaesturariibacter flavus TaxID=2502780 RepID=A0A4R1BKE5_9BACT|nr:RNA polymerase sigma factor [Flaviaesturariibacter flavus]
MERCIRQDHREQRALYEHFYGYCLKTVFRYVYHYDNAVDVVNDGFVKVFRNLEKFRQPPGVNLEMIFMGWMKTIMVNTAIDFLRRNSFLQEVGALSDSVWEEAAPGVSSDNALLYKELITEVRKLPPAYRTVFNMYVIDGFSHQEIADQLGIAVGTSKSNLAKARMSLQRIIKKSEPEQGYAISK